MRNWLYQLWMPGPYPLPPMLCLSAEPELASFCESATFDHGPVIEPLAEPHTLQYRHGPGVPLLAAHLFMFYSEQGAPVPVVARASPE